jgi:hypothetical protein
MADVSFPVPEGFQAPENIKEGQEFDFMARGYYKGKDMYLTQVEGNQIGEAAEPPPEAEAEQAAEQSSGQPEVEMGMVDAVEKGMRQKK